jgi:hypothetical protein
MSTALSVIEIEEKQFELMQRKAKIYSESSLVPDAYKKNIGNVLIATNMAERMGADILMVMQNLYIVHGRPGWSAQFLIACFNSCGRFTAIKYAFGGDGDDYGCIAYATELASGERIEGVRVTIGMAKAEGWSTKNGSKWKTMPDLMLRYRSATFLIRCTAPEIGLGLQTAEEITDTIEGRVTRSAVTADDIGRLLAPTPKTDDYAAQIEAAETLPDLYAIEAEMLALPNPDQSLLDRVVDKLAGMAAEASV